jgi:homoserine acetyltransferase
MQIYLCKCIYTYIHTSISSYVYLHINMYSYIYYHHQEELVAGIRNCEYHLLATEDGHDGFLLEQGRVGIYISDFLNGVPHHSKL